MHNIYKRKVNRSLDIHDKYSTLQNVPHQKYPCTSYITNYGNTVLIQLENNCQPVKKHRHLMIAFENENTVS